MYRVTVHYEVLNCIINFMQKICHKTDIATRLGCLIPDKLKVNWVERSLRVWKVGGWNPRSGQVKDLKIGTCCFPG